MYLWVILQEVRGFPGGASGKELACQCRRCKRHKFDPWVEKIPWRRPSGPHPDGGWWLCAEIPDCTEPEADDWNSWMSPCYLSASLVTKVVKNLPAIWETWVPSLGQKDPLEKGMAAHSNILPGKSYGQNSLVGYSPWGPKELDRTEWLTLWLFDPFQVSSVAQTLLTLCYPKDCSMPGFPIHHQLPELAQTHVCWVGNPVTSPLTNQKKGMPLCRSYPKRCL